jgi:hypothetical protein
VWAANGFLFKLGALDFAGGTVVHINAGVAGLVGAYMLGPRIGFGRERMSPHSLPLTFTGAALLWVGWFGFNAGSALEANGVAALAFVNTLVAGAAAVLAWSAIEAKYRGRASMLGAASGAISGLVAITPACGSVGIGGALAIGACGGVAGFWGVNALKHRMRADDSLDLFGIHGVCGIVGALLTGVFSAPVLGGSGAPDQAIWHQIGVQALGIVITVLWYAMVALLAFWSATRSPRIVASTRTFWITSFPGRSGVVRVCLVHHVGAWSHRTPERWLLGGCTSGTSRIASIFWPLIPTQIVTEYFRRVFQQADKTRLDGLIYRSSRYPGGKAFVLFCENAQCVDPGEEKAPWEKALLRLDQVAHAPCPAPPVGS